LKNEKRGRKGTKHSKTGGLRKGGSFPKSGWVKKTHLTEKAKDQSTVKHIQGGSGLVYLTKKSVELILGKKNKCGPIRKMQKGSKTGG